MTMHRVYLLAVVLVCTVAVLKADLVEIKGLGTVEGTQYGDIIEYLGIPYAEPPVGANRFRAPQPVNPWSNTFKANRRVACVQAMPSKYEQDEDCLVINIWRSASSIESTEKLPVLLWLHPGAWRQGSGVGMFNATNYAREGLIVVSINYRLDTLGFFAHKALSEEDPSNPTNFGLLDQRLALDWISQHIGAFNGNPNHVTVMGSSAGAQSIVIHMQSWQEYKPKFHKAIIMSAYPLLTTIYLNQAEDIGEKIVETVGCDYKDGERVLECLRSLPAEELLVARSPRLQFFGSTYRDTMLYINDGVNFKSSPRVFFNGKYDLNIPVIIGAAAQEGTLFAKFAFPFVSMSEHLQITMLASFSRHYVQSADPTMMLTLLQNYTKMNPRFAGSSDPSFEAYAELVGDSYFLCPSLRLLNALSQKQAAFGYIFTHLSDDSFARHLGAHHGGDLKYAFGADVATIPGKQNEPEKIFAKKVVTYFTKFIKTGTPGGAGLPQWPIYAPEGKLMALEPDFKVLEHYKEEVCAFWEKNFPSGIAYTGEDYFHPADESLLSKLVNKYPFMVIYFLWRKRRFFKPAVAVLSIVTVLFWYKVITKCCCRNKKVKNSNNNNNNKNDKTTVTKKNQ